MNLKERFCKFAEKDGTSQYRNFFVEKDLAFTEIASQASSAPTISISTYFQTLKVSRKPLPNSLNLAVPLDPFINWTVGFAAGAFKSASVAPHAPGENPLGAGQPDEVQASNCQVPAKCLTV